MTKGLSKHIYPGGPLSLDSHDSCSILFFVCFFQESCNPFSSFLAFQNFTIRSLWPAAFSKEVFSVKTRKLSSVRALLCLPILSGWVALGCVDSVPCLSLQSSIFCTSGLFHSFWETSFTWSFTVFSHVCDSVIIRPISGVFYFSHPSLKS